MSPLENDQKGSRYEGNLKHFSHVRKSLTRLRKKKRNPLTNSQMNETQQDPSAVGLKLSFKKYYYYYYL